MLNTRWGLRASSVVAALATLAVLAATPASAGGSDYPNGRTYEVTVTNLTDGQILTPPVWAAHTQRADFVQRGHAASYELQQLAENGNTAPLDELFSNSRHVRANGVAPDGPIPAGTSRTYEITVPANVRRLTSLSMVVCTNDGFTGLDSKRLPARVGHTRTYRPRAYDAGTELNTEALADLVPPCSGGATGTGETDPALAENGVVRRHRGITNDGTNAELLDPEIWGFSRAVVSYEITRIG